MPYFWTGGKISDVRAVVTTDLNDFEPLSSVPLGLAQNLFGLCAVVYAVPLALPLVLVAGIVWRRVAFPKTWVFTHMIPLCNKQVYQRPLSFAAEEYDSNVTIRAMKAQDYYDSVMQRAAMSLAYARFYLWGGLLLKDVLSLPIKAVFVACAVGSVLHVQAHGGDAAQALVLYNVCWGLVKKIDDLNWKLDKAVERLVQYRNIENFINTEYVETSEGVDPPSDWPKDGAITFCDASFRYFPHGPFALQNATVEIKPGERVGIVGPTGAGKSTFVKLLLRLGPLSGSTTRSAGSVRVDGIDIATLPLRALREAIGVVPQEPMIFEDTLKHNLGGDSENDADALQALAACGLNKLSVAGLLHEPLSKDLSVGEKQLLAAARVLLRKPRVLVLDEATSSLSQASADLLIDAVGKHCSKATVLTVSHRLRYILQCDRVVVMNRGGRIAAFDTPARLQAQSDGYFACQLRVEADGCVRTGVA
jgi:ABC-type multidrug transport system fused ATPase/permease subunit